MTTSIINGWREKHENHDLGERKYVVGIDSVFLMGLGEDNALFDESS